MAISLQNRQRKVPVETAWLRRLGQKVLSDLGHPGLECSVVLVDDAAMAGLNATYRGETSATDVLAFPMGEGRFHDLNRGLLGDVVISVETARRQSRPDHGGLRAELALLLVHGILHLFGYHHGDARNRRHMWRRQRAILSSCGIQVTAAARRHRSGGRSGAGTPKRDAGLEAAGR